MSQLAFCHQPSEMLACSWFLGPPNGSRRPKPCSCSFVPAPSQVGSHHIQSLPQCPVAGQPHSSRANMLGVAGARRCYWTLSSILSPSSSPAVTHGCSPPRYISACKPSTVSYLLSVISPQLASDVPPICAAFMAPPRRATRGPGGLMGSSRGRSSFHR